MYGASTDKLYSQASALDHNALAYRSLDVRIKMIDATRSRVTAVVAFINSETRQLSSLSAGQPYTFGHAVLRRCLVDVNNEGEG